MANITTDQFVSTTDRQHIHINLNKSTVQIESAIQIPLTKLDPADQIQTLSIHEPSCNSSKY